MIQSMAFRHHSLGIEITDTHVKLCELRYKGSKHTKIVRYATYALEEGTMNDGRIQNEKLLLQAMRSVLNDHPWSTKIVHFAVPSQSVMIRFLKLPNVNDKMLRKIVDIEIKNNIHLPFDDPYYDYVKLEATGKKVLKSKKSAKAIQEKWDVNSTEVAAQGNSIVSESESEDTNSENLCNVMLTAASMELLHQYVRIFSELGLQLRSMEIKAFSLTRLLEKYMPTSSQGLTLIADISGTNCDLTIVNGGIIEITRNVPTAFIAQKAYNSDKTIDQMFLEFLPQKDNYEASFSDLAGEMERLMNFYRYTLNHREADFSQLIVSGDIPMLDDLVEYLSGRMTQDVSSVQSNAIEMDSVTKDWSLPHYAVPLGLCLRGKQ